MEPELLLPHRTQVMTTVPSKRKKRQLDGHWLPQQHDPPTLTCTHHSFLSTCLHGRGAILPVQGVGIPPLPVTSSVTQGELLHRLVYQLLHL